MRRLCLAALALACVASAAGPGAAPALAQGTPPSADRLWEQYPLEPPPAPQGETPATPASPSPAGEPSDRERATETAPDGGGAGPLVVLAYIALAIGAATATLLLVALLPPGRGRRPAGDRLRNSWARVGAVVRDRGLPRPSRPRAATDRETVAAPLPEEHTPPPREEPPAPAEDPDSETARAAAALEALKAEAAQTVLTLRVEMLRSLVAARRAAVEAEVREAASAAGARPAAASAGTDAVGRGENGNDSPPAGPTAATPVAGGAAANAAPVAAGEAAGPWETCEITWWHGSRRGGFDAHGTTPEGRDRIVARSVSVRWASDESPPDAGPAGSAHARLVERLVDQGWEPYEEGSAWYNRRFRRRAAGHA